jgi:hypothetical protein
VDYEENGIRITAILGDALFGRMKKYIPGYVEIEESW